MAEARHARVTVNPSSDDEFYRLVERLAREVSDARALERRVRERYPAAVVVRSVLSGEPADSWYVYRDGHWSDGGSAILGVTEGAAPELSS